MVEYQFRRKVRVIDLFHSTNVRRLLIWPIVRNLQILGHSKSTNFRHLICGPDLQKERNVVAGVCVGVQEHEGGSKHLDHVNHDDGKVKVEHDAHELLVLVLLVGEFHLEREGASDDAPLHQLKEEKGEGGLNVRPAQGGPGAGQGQKERCPEQTEGRCQGNVEQRQLDGRVRFHDRGHLVVLGCNDRGGLELDGVVRSPEGLEHVHLNRDVQRDPQSRSVERGVQRYVTKAGADVRQKAQFGNEETREYDPISQDIDRPFHLCFLVLVLLPLVKSRVQTQSNGGGKVNEQKQGGAGNLLLRGAHGHRARAPDAGVTIAIDVGEITIRLLKQNRPLVHLIEQVVVDDPQSHNQSHNQRPHNERTPSPSRVQVSVLGRPIFQCFESVHLFLRKAIMRYNAEELRNKAMQMFFDGAGKNPHVPFYNEFVEIDLPNVPNIVPFKYTDVNYEIKCTGFEVEDKPHRNGSPFHPHQARGMINGNYVVQVFAIIEVQSQSEAVATWRVPIFHLPVMVGSKLCWSREHLDGYFILNGVCRVILMQEHQVTNKNIVIKSNNRQIKEIVSVIRAKNPVTNVVAEITMGCGGPGKPVVLRHHFFNSKQEKNEIPCDLFLTALGSHNYQGESEMVQDEAIEELATYFNKHKFSDTGSAKTIESVAAMFPHVPVENILSTAELMREKLDAVIQKKRKLDYNDALDNKRFETCRKLIRDLVVDSFGKMIRTWTYKLKELEVLTLSKIKNVLTSNTCGSFIDTAFRTGAWVMPHSNHPKLDVTEELRQENIWTSMSQLRRTTSASVGTKSSKQVEPRLMHPTTFGMFCMSEVVDGDKLGIAKHLGMFSTYSHARNLTALVKIVQTYAQEGTHHFVLNGVPLMRLNGEHMREFLLNLRRHGKIYADVSIALDETELRVNGDEGRVMQCLFVSGREQDLHRCLTWRDALNAGIFELLDSDEEWFNARISDDFGDPLATHIRIHAVGLFGSSASSIPFGNHNQAPRLTFYSQMLKRAVCPRMSTESSFSSKSYEMVYGQRPLVVNRVSETLLGVRPVNAEQRRMGEDAISLQFGGQNLVVMIGTHAYTGEDAFVVSDSAFGMGLTISYDTYKFDVNSSHETVMRTSATDERGVLLRDTRVEPYDPILFKFNKKTGKETCEHVGAQQRGWVDETKTLQSDNKYQMAIRIRQERPLKVGNKMHFRPGQKGTIAKVVPKHEMPYSLATGMVPDLIINTNAFPSRMTISFFLEGAAGKVACFEGGKVDGTAFDKEVDLDEMERLLQKRGLGMKERMMDPRTGEMSQELVWIGIVFGQINAKFSDDAMYSRAKGPVSAKTRQPTSGRANEGAVRFGEMETWTLLAHGASEFAADRLRDNADLVEFYVCECGKRYVTAQECCGPTRLVKSKYAWILAQNTLRAAGIRT